MAEPLLLFLRLQFLQALARFFEVFLIDDLLLGQAVEVGGKLLPRLRFLGSG
jgi:hypothetical protein